MENFEKPNIPENPLQSSENEQILHAPEGWKTVNGISSEKDLSIYSINRVIDEYRESNPEYFKEFKSKTGAMREHLSPELISILIEKSKEVVSAPEGWQTMTSLAKELDVDRDKLLPLINKYRQHNPDYYKAYKASNQTTEHLSPELILLIRKEIEEYKNIQEAPDGWKSQNKIVTELETTDRVLETVIGKYPETNPEYFHDYKVKGQGQIVKHFSPELVEIITKGVKEFKNIPYAPEGWKTMTSIQKEFSVRTNAGIFASLIDKYRNSNPEYFKVFKDNAHKPSEYFSPELVKIIELEAVAYRQIKVVPEEWENINTAAQKFNVAPTVIQRIADPYRISNPEYFDKFRSKNSQVNEYFSPELVSIINNTIEQKASRWQEKNKDITVAPDGWHAIRNLSGELGVDPATVTKEANEYRKDHPEYFNFFKTKTRSAEYYSPELVSLLREKIGKYSPAPEGWRTTTNIATELEAARETIKNIAEQYRDSHPEYFSIFKDKAGKAAIHYSTELVKIIKERILEIPETPAGWKTRTAIFSETGINIKTISSLIEEYRKTNPEYFKTFKNNGHIREHLSPELISIVIEKDKEIKKTPEAPAGWLPVFQLAKEFEINMSTVINLAAKYRKNEEYFKDYRNSIGKISEHYSPELVEILRRDFQSIPDRAQSEWKTNSALSLELGLTARRIGQIADLYRDSHPEYFKYFRNIRGSVNIHYSPELIEIIKNEAEKFKSMQSLTPEVPESWRSVQDIAEKAGVSREEAEKIAKKIREKYQGQYGKFKDKSND
jgi:hypothetical protein